MVSFRDGRLLRTARRRHPTRAAPRPREREEGNLRGEESEDGRQSVILRLLPEDRPSTGSILKLAIAPNALRLFDPSTGSAIEPP